VYPARESLGLMLGHLPCSRPGWVSADKAKSYLFKLLTVLFLAAAFAAAVLVPAIEVVFSINGAFMGLAIAFYLPAGMYVKAARDNPDGSAAGAVPSAVGVLAVSIPLGLAAAVMTLTSLGEGEGGGNSTDGCVH
jgi:hypothetical protein